MEVKHFTIAYDSLGVTMEKIEKFMGYEKGSIPEPFPDLISNALAVAPGYCDIQGGYRIIDNYQLNRKEHQLSLERTTFEISRIIAYQMRKAEKAALFVCTAGEGISAWSKKLMQEGDLMKGYVVDVIGSEIVEAAMDRIQDHLAEEMQHQNFGITDRYSPGYCDWKVSEQPKLFSFFPEKFCGISLSDSCLMYPIKSVSGVIGIGEEAERKGYLCEHCDMKNCIYRNKRYQVSC